MPAAYFTGDSHGQSKEACCDAQEKLETRQGKRQTRAQEGRKAHDAEKGKVQGPACGQRCPEIHGQEKAATDDPGKKGTKKTPRQVVEVPVEDTIIDVIEEPVPGVVVLLSTNRFGRRLPLRSAASLSAASVPRRKNNKSIRFVDGAFGVEAFLQVTVQRQR